MLTGEAVLRNDILARLPQEESQRLESRLDPVFLPLGRVLYQPGDNIQNVFFPLDCVVSLVCTTENGMTAEVGLTGKDGVVGTEFFLGQATSMNLAIVQVGGRALRISAIAASEEFERTRLVRREFLQYTGALMVQISQTAVCNRLHSVERRLCRWLLLCHDRVASDDIAMTQEFIATMLGGRRESVTVAAGHLQDAGIIRYSRGHIRILDRKGVEANACECYRAVVDHLRNRAKAAASGRSE